MTMIVLPKPEKLWQFNANQLQTVTGSAAETQARIFVTVKNSLKGFGLAPWTVKGSSDAATAGLDGTDRIVDFTKVVSGGGNHSWIVLKQPGTGLEIVCDFNGAGPYLMTIMMSVNGLFTGGSISARPTAADEVGSGSAVHWLYGNNNVQARIHVLHSSDGQNTFVFVMANIVASLWIFGRAGDAVAPWLKPSIGALGGSAGIVAGAIESFRWLFDNANIAAYEGASMPLFTTIEGFGVDFPTETSLPVQIDQANNITGEWYFHPMGLISNTAGKKGRHGRLIDLWAGAPTLASGDEFPGDGSKKFAVFGEWIVPWNGSAPLVA